MTDRIVEISASLWLIVPDVDPEYDDGLLTLRDDSGGNTLIDRADIGALVKALKREQEGKA